MIIYECQLPFPPSVNSAYGNRSNQKRFKSKKYKEWEKAAPELELPECGSIEFSVKIIYTLYMPDKRKRDLSNYIKIPEDYLVSHGVLWDDNHTIASCTEVRFGGIDRGDPRVCVTIIREENDGVRKDV